MNFEKLNRLALPERPRCGYDNLTENEYQLIIQVKTRLDNAVHNAVLEYLNDENLCNDEGDIFPCRKRMTGDYYVSDEYYRLSESGVQGSIFTRFTETSNLPNAVPSEQDYLGLEVWFTIHRCGGIEIYGIDSSSI